MQQGLLLSTVKRAMWSYRHIYHCWLASTKAMSFFPPFFSDFPLVSPKSFYDSLIFILSLQNARGTKRVINNRL